MDKKVGYSTVSGWHGGPLVLAVKHWRKMSVRIFFQNLTTKSSQIGLNLSELLIYDPWYPPKSKNWDWGTNSNANKQPKKPYLGVVNYNEISPGTHFWPFGDTMGHK